MPSVRVRSDLNSGIYFLTLTVKNWYYLLDRHDRWEILRQSLQHCCDNKQLKIHAWVFMINHIHLLVEHEDVSGFLRDFKAFTTNQLRSSMLAHEPSILPLFEEPGGKYAIWQATNLPQKIETPHFYQQKFDYIHENPIRKNYVNKAKDWKYSSANPQALLPLTMIEW